MAFKYDKVFFGGYVVDPQNRRKGFFDVATKDGKIVAVGVELDRTMAKEAIDASGMHVLPGIIDCHVHLAGENGVYGHRMLAAAGVTTALEIAGPIGEAIDAIKSGGTGLNIAILDQIRPGVSVADENLDLQTVEDFIGRCLEEGGLGVKILGGHYPLTPEATARAIEAADNSTAYISFHAGTKATGSDLNGALEAIELAGGRPLHLAHVNSYCRGTVKKCWLEAEDMIAALIKNPNIRPESYIATLNGCSAHCADGVPSSLVTRRCLRAGGFAETEQGMEQAILGDWAQININASGMIEPVTGPKALEYWRGKGTDCEVSFGVNPPEARYRLAVAKKDNGSFVVDCLGTDGGIFPRNVIVSMGLSLVKLSAWTIEEFVLKTSINPAKWFALPDKGHFSEGADADISIVDFANQKPITTVVGGNIIMHRGVIIPHPTTVITTQIGRKAIEAAGLKTHIIDITDTGYFKGMGK